MVEREHQTRLKVLDDNVKTISEAQSGLRRDVDTLTNAFDRQECLIQEVIGRLSTLQVQTHTNATPRGFMEGEGSTPLDRHKPAPIQMARFFGLNPDRWVLQAEQYFEFYDIKLEDRITIASFYFDEASADWFDWMYKNRQLTGWPVFTATILQRFRPHDLKEPEGLLAKLQQTTTISDYRSRFEAITNHTIYLPGQFLTHCFISGLRAEIKHSVLVHKPTTLDEAMQLALLHE